MSSQRSSADDTVVLRPTAEPPGAAPADGVTFRADPAGRRSSTAVGKRVFADAVRTAAPQLAQAILDEADWRHRYPEHIRRLVELAIAQPAAAVQIARRGLDSIYRNAEFGRDGDVLPLDLALRALPPDRLHTVTIAGQSRATPKLEVPYRGERLSGAALSEQSHRWVERGIAEPSFAAAIDAVIANPDWLDLSDWNIAALGAGAESGPFETLACWRATLIAVDVPNPGLWRRLADIARRGNGRVRIPVRQGSAADDPRLPDLAGADLLTATPQIRNWLVSMPEPLAIGCFACLDGEAHARLSVAMDAIIADLIALRRNVVPAYLLAPADCYAVPAQAAELAAKRWYTRGAARLWQEPLRWASRSRLLTPNVLRIIESADGLRTGIVDALIAEQGQNHAFAKRLQQWRALVARADGLRVSANVAPAARTQSVIRHRALKAACHGARRFGVEVFEPGTAAVLMAALLVHDLRTTSAAAAPDTELAHPLQLFMDGALHGGLWTVPFAPRSALPVAALLGRL